MSVEDWPEPAYAIRTDRMVLRCYERDDVERVHREVLKNIEPLRPWMPWIEHEPMSLDERASLLRRFRGRFDVGEDFIYGIFEPTGTRLLGGCGLHPRVGPRSLEIGYWIVRDRWGEGLATEVAAALTRVGFERMGAHRMEIRVSPKNKRSLAIPRKLGYREEGLLRRVLPMGGGVRDDLTIFGMLQSEWTRTPAARVSVSMEGFASDA